ncbi:MAG TPA: hypothetical protein ENJ95_20985 [Bacteroidetes bacterium]|nr:hypothetical protein [Bacteroidota bacterium]
MKLLLRWANILLILVTLLAYLSPHINPLKVWHFSFLGLAYPFLLLGNLLFMFFWLWRKNRYFLFSAGCILAGMGYFSGFIGWHLFNENKESGDAVSVMTYNVAGLRGYFSKKGKTGDGRVKDFKNLFPEKGKPDIFCVQEAYRKNVTEKLQSIFHFPYFHKNKGVLIYSKYPFLDKGAVAFEKSDNSCVWADLKTPQGTIRVYSAHLQSNWLTYTALKVAEEADLREKKTWQGIAQVMRLYKRAVIKRAAQAEKIAAHMAKSPHPVLLCGDLNDTPVSYVYHILSKNLQDSFCEKGFGFDFTFAGKIPGLRIDFVLADRQFEIKSHEVPHLELSDHYPVLVKLSLGD